MCDAWSGTYAEMETGGTALAFAQEDFVAQTVGALRRHRADEPAAATEIGLVTESVDGAFARAVDAGAAAIVPPLNKPWGQRVAYVRDLDGCLVEICSPVAPPA